MADWAADNGGRTRLAAMARTAIASDDGAPCRSHHATTPLAKAGAATSAAAPRRRGYCSGGTTVIGVAPAGGVSARSASPARTVASIRSQAAVISPPM